MSKQTMATKMLKQYSRRQVLGGAVSTVTLGTLALFLGARVSPVSAGEQALIGSQCMTILYPHGDDITFDFEYYKNKHMTLIMDLYGKSIRRFELRKGMPGPDGSKPSYIATINIWIADLEAFTRFGEEHSQTLIDDVPNFTNGMPTIQADEVYAVTET